VGERPLQRFTLARWARRVGLTPRQARYAVNKGELGRLQLPAGGRVERSHSGRLEVLIPANGPPLAARRVALYARAWHPESRGALERQVAILQTWAAAQELDVIATVRETAGPLDLPERLLALVTDPGIPVIVVANKDALGWLNAPFLTAILESQGRALIDLGVSDHCLREEWRAMDAMAALLRRLLDQMRRSIEHRLPRPRDPPPMNPLPPR
jgi:predicted site-specific integrase-resolvase